MNDILSNFLKILKVKGIDFLLATYDGKVIEKTSGISAGIKSSSSSESLKQLYKENFDAKDDSSQFKMRTVEKLHIINFPIYRKILLLDAQKIGPAIISEFYFFTELLNSVDESIIFIDRNNKIQYANYVFLTRYGFDESLLLGSIISEILPPEHLEQMLKGLKVNRSRDYSIEIYDRMGELNPVNIKRIIWDDINILVLYDVKEKEGFTRQIEGLQRLQDMIFDSIAQGIIVLDKEANIIKFNKFTRERYKFTNEEVIGRNIFEIIPDLKQLKIDKIFIDIIENKKSRKLLGVKRYSKRLKTELIQNFYGYPLIEGGRVIGTVILIDDITEKRMFEEEFELMQKRSEIVNILNGMLSETIETDVLLKKASSYLSEKIGAERIYFFNAPKSELLEYTDEGLMPAKLKNASETAEKFTKTDASNITIIDDTKETEALFGRKNVRSVVIVPVLFKKQYLGAFILENAEDVKGDRIKLEILKSFFEHIGNVLDKALVYQEKKENLHTLEFILKISRILSQTKDYHKTFKSVVEEISTQFNADRCFFNVKSEREDVLRTIAAVGIDEKQLMEKVFFMDKGVVGHVASTKEALNLENALDFKKLEYTKGFRRRKQAMISVPVIYRGELVGVLSMSRFGTLPFSKSDFELAKIIASYSAGYVKNIFLQMQMENKIDQLSFLYKISTSIRTIVNIPFLKRVITTTMGSITKSDFICLYERKENDFVLADTYFRDMAFKESLKEKKLLHKNIFSQIKQNGVTHLESDSKFINSAFGSDVEKITALSVVINQQNEYIIIIGYLNQEHDQISDDTYMAVIQELGIKIESAILFEENEQKLKQYNTISSMAMELTRIRDLNEFFNYLLKSAVEIVNGKVATIMLLEGKELVFKASYGVDIEKLRDIHIPVGTGVAGYVAKSGKKMIVNNVQSSRQFIEIEPLTEHYHVYNLVNVPLLSRGKVIGVLCVDNKKNGDFTKSDAHFLETMANTLIIAIEQFIGSKFDKKLSDIILDNISSGIVYVDKNGCLSLVNKGFGKIYGARSKATLGSHYSDVFEDKSGAIDSAIRKGIAVLRQEVMLKRANGELVPCGISVTPVKTDANHEAVCIIQDLSEIKRMQSELKAKENLAMLGQMAAGMAHEIKNPLAGILTGIEFLRMQVGDENHILVESTDLIMKEVRRLDRLVNDMTSFAKTKTQILVEADLMDIIKRAVDLIRSRMEEAEVEIDIENLSSNTKMEIDEEQMVEVLINILINAIQAIDKKGRIEVTITDEGSNVSIRIFNTGPHIPQEVAEKIFTPFFTTKSGGTGLGLAISYNILKDHGGSIKVINEEGGVSFNMILPRRKIRHE